MRLVLVSNLISTVPWAMLLWSPKTLLMPYSQRGVPVWYKNSLTVTLAKPAHIWHKWWHMFISGRAKVIQFSKHILPYKFRRCYIRFLILLFSFIVRQGFSLPLANVASGSKAKEKPEMPQMAGITAKSIYKRGFSWDLSTTILENVTAKSIYIKILSWFYKISKYSRITVQCSWPWVSIYHLR